MTKNLPWIIGIFGAICFFAYFEAAAFAHPDRYNTLSHFIATIGARWPLSIFLMGSLSGGLAVHFFLAMGGQSARQGRRLDFFESPRQ